VAQLYQRGFARRRGKAWQVKVIDRASGRATVRNVADNFKRRDWNTVVDEGGEPHFDVELGLASTVDGPAAPVIAALRDGELPDDHDSRLALARFMGAQLVRGREVRENLAETMTAVQHQLLSLAAQHYTDAHWRRAVGSVPTPEQVAQIADSRTHFDIKPTTGALLDALLAGVDEYADLLMRRTWTLLRFAEPALFTGEHPIVHVPGASGGFGIVTAERFHFPISTQVALVLSHPWSSWPEDFVVADTSDAARLNWATFTHPANGELMMHPEASGHPMPRPSFLLAFGIRWPWGTDPDALTPPSLELLATRAPEEPPQRLAT
jgi:hypothetical protein